MKGRLGILLALVLHATLLTFCVAQEMDNGHALAKQNEHSHAELHFRGVIRPYRHIVLRSPIDSQVLQVASQTGQEVAPETVLIQLDTQTMEREVHLAQTQLAKIRADLKACELGLEQIDRATSQLREGKKEVEQRLVFARRTQPPLGYPGRVVENESNVMRSPMRKKGADQILEAIDDIEASRLRLRSNRSRLLSLREDLQRAEHATNAAIRVTQKSLDEASVTANVKGIVARYFVQPSDRVNAGDELVEVIQTDRLRATLWLPDKVAASFDFQAMPWNARIRVSNTEKSWQKGIVREVTPLPHPQTKQAMLEVEVDNGDRTLRTGMWVDAILEPSETAQASRKRSLQ